ncbi:hypothetical protein KUTeg_006271 [Tegillarca granosa]|uniref:Uncharacterized protein n=1 Tax=Tegillarca granosa TaxID=220873 RepID=A0ABQ9FJZ6_TEGGR|nr:hypothetical protein KUTeg_006271 [Tegillarca granosa]
MSENQNSEFENEDVYTDGSEYSPSPDNNDSTSESGENFSDADGGRISGIDDIKLIESRKRIRKRYHNPPTSKKAKTVKSSSQNNRNSRRPLIYTPSASSSNSRNSTPRITSGIEGLNTTSSQSNSPQQDSLAQKTNDARLTAVEKAIKVVEKNQQEILKIQKEILYIGAVRDGHSSGRDSGLEWTVSKENVVMRPNSEENKAMTKYIFNFVKGLYSETEESVIEVATERYFKSLKEKNNRESRGKTDAFNKKMVLYQRRKRKLTNRRGAINKKTSWTPEVKDKVSKALTIDYISSEYEEESDGESVYIVRPLTWRSDEMNNIIKELDKKIESFKSKCAKRQTSKRVIGEVVSNRQCPDVEEEFSWTIKQQTQ